MFQLFADSTPNARKVSIMLEEINENYQVSLIDLDKGEQFSEDFKKISPFSKIPVLKNLKTINTITTGRYNIMISDLKLWEKNFIFGTGVGGSKILRGNETNGIASHNEFSRLLAEHGLFGFLFIIMLFLPMYSLRITETDLNDWFVLIRNIIIFILVFNLILTTLSPFPNSRMLLLLSVIIILPSKVIFFSTV